MTQYINPRQKIFWHGDRLAELQATGSTSAPINVEIDLSNRCSRNCYFCHFAYTHTRGPLASIPKPDGLLDCGDLMDYDVAGRILSQLKSAGVKSVTFTGGGEPTLHPRFDDVIDVAATLDLDVGLYTHGGHIDNERAQLLKERLTFVYVSLDECTEEEYTVTKGKGFAAACEGISRLALADGNATIGVGFLLHPNNMDKIHRMVRLGKDLGADYVQFRPIIHYDQDEPGKLIEDTAWMDTAIAHLGAYTNDPFVSVDLQRFRMYQHWQGHGYPVCNWSAMQTVITPNGHLWRCVNKRGRSGALLGDLSKEPFAAIWQRAGGPCFVDGSCRTMCRGHLANLSLDAIMTQPAHANFV